MLKQLHIGVLALQGDFAEHIEKLRGLGCTTTEVRRTSDLRVLDGLVIPGGESTAIAKLETVASQLKDSAPDPVPLFDAIAKLGARGFPIWGTCMGSILLAKEIEGSAQGRIGLMNITVRRNAFGHQKASSKRNLVIPTLGADPFPGIFIRAPLFLRSGSNVDVLCSLDTGFVMAREGNLLATAFHPEVTSDDRVHQYFLRMIQ